MLPTRYRSHALRESCACVTGRTLARHRSDVPTDAAAARQLGTITSLLRTISNEIRFARRSHRSRSLATSVFGVVGERRPVDDGERRAGGAAGDALALRAHAAWRRLSRYAFCCVATRRDRPRDRRVISVGVCERPCS